MTRAGDTVARLGGDEFAVLLESGGAAQAAERVLAALTQPASAGRHLVSLAASIGVAQLDPIAPTPSPAALLQRADAAMYQSKRQDKGTPTTWTEQLQAAVAAP